MGKAINRPATKITDDKIALARRGEGTGIKATAVKG